MTKQNGEKTVPIKEMLKELYDKYDCRAAMQYDPVPKIQRLLAKGYLLGQDGKLRPGLTSKSVTAPWIYVRRNEKLNCTFSQEVFFNTFDIFPRSCLDCWKVVVRPRSIEELIMLLELEENYTDKPCKCGIEVRDYVPALYGGYFYCNGKEEGLDRLDEVRELVSYHISPEIPVTLKRYCTEFELKFGPSDEIEQTLMRGYYNHPDRGKVSVMPMSEQQVWHAIAEAIVDVSPDHSEQAMFVRQHVIAEWFKFAWKFDKANAEKFIGNQPLYTPSKTYERNAVTEDLDNEFDDRNLEAILDKLPDPVPELSLEHKKIYNRIPSFECEPGCDACCGPMQDFSKWEWNNVTDKKFPVGNRCPYTSPEGCTIYEQRPLICRMFGSCEDMPCPKGYGPEKLLSLEASKVLITEYNMIGGNQDA